MCWVISARTECRNLQLIAQATRIIYRRFCARVYHGASSVQRRQHSIDTAFSSTHVCSRATSNSKNSRFRFSVLEIKRKHSVLFGGFISGPGSGLVLAIGLRAAVVRSKAKSLESLCNWNEKTEHVSDISNVRGHRDNPSTLWLNRRQCISLLHVFLFCVWIFTKSWLATKIFQTLNLAKRDFLGNMSVWWSVMLLWNLHMRKRTQVLLLSHHVAQQCHPDSRIHTLYITKWSRGERRKGDVLEIGHIGNGRTGASHGRSSGNLSLGG